MTDPGHATLPGRGAPGPHGHPPGYALPDPEIPMRRRFALASVLIAGPWGGLALILDRYGLREVEEGTYDIIVIAGCPVQPDGGPSPALARRVERAVTLWRQGRAPRLLFTGGVGTWPPSEAEAAAAHARSLGVPAEVLLLEDRSTSTEENARNAALAFPAERALVVTDTYHAFRVERVFGRYFSDVQVVASRSPVAWRTRGALREVGAVAWYGLTGRLGLRRDAS